MTSEQARRWLDCMIASKLKLRLHIDNNIQVCCDVSENDLHVYGPNAVKRLATAIYGNDDNVQIKSPWCEQYPHTSKIFFMYNDWEVFQLVPWEEKENETEVTD